MGGVETEGGPSGCGFDFIIIIMIIIIIYLWVNKDNLLMKRRWTRRTS